MGNNTLGQNGHSRIIYITVCNARVYDRKKRCWMCGTRRDPDGGCGECWQGQRNKLCPPRVDGGKVALRVDPR